MLCLLFRNSPATTPEVIVRYPSERQLQAHVSLYVYTVKSLYKGHSRKRENVPL